MTWLGNTEQTHKSSNHLRQVARPIEDEIPKNLIKVSTLKLPSVQFIGPFRREVLSKWSFSYCLLLRRKEYEKYSCTSVGDAGAMTILHRHIAVCTSKKCTSGMWMICKILFCTQNFPRKTETVYNNVPRPKYFKHSWNSKTFSIIVNHWCSISRSISA